MNVKTGMEPQFNIIEEKKLIGKKIEMSFNNNKTRHLWSSFSIEIHKIKNIVGTNKYSLQVYDTSFFKEFNPDKIFCKWALVEVENFDSTPIGMEAFLIPKGLYAIFRYRGHPVNGNTFFQYIFTNWLPNSKYELDNRPHFEILGDKYKNNAPSSEEDIYIPIKIKNS